MSTKDQTSVFRRGGEKLSEGDPDEVIRENLEILGQVWSRHRAGRDQSIGVWEKDMHLVRIMRAKGKLLHSMGFFMNKMQYLHIEEGLFLMDRGSLLLYQNEHDGSGDIVSLQQAYQLLMTAGVAMDRFAVYLQLKGKGWIVRRYPVQWSVADGDIPDNSWKNWGIVKPVYIEDVTVAPQDTKTQPSSSVKLPGDSSTMDSQQTHACRGWWPCASDTRAWLHTSKVHPTDAKKALLAPSAFPSISSSKDADASSPMEVVYAVFSPNASFKRRSPGEPVSMVCMGGDSLPDLLQIKAVECSMPSTPLVHAHVENGDIMFFTLTPHHPPL